MVFGKKKVQPKEDPVVTSVQEATEHEPVTEAPRPELTPAQQRAAMLVQEFDANYGGVVTNAPDHVRASLQFATYGEVYALVEEQHRTNELLAELVELVKKQS